MEYFEIGCCFKSYEELMEKLSKYCGETYTKFTTKDCRLIKDEFVENSEPKSRLIYTDLKLICVHGRTVRPKNPNAKRKRTEKNVQTGCPAYFRLKLIHSGVALQIVALNVKHNHSLDCPKDEEVIYSGKRDKSKRNARTKVEKKFKEEPINGEDSESENDQEFVDAVISDSNDVFEICFDLKGFCTPVLTPFKDDMAISTEEIFKYSKYLDDKGITAVLVNSSIGESTALTIYERKLVVETWKEAVKSTKQHLMVHIGSCSLENCQELAKHAEKLKVNSIVCPPQRNPEPKTVENLIDYLRIISESASKTPLLYHHDPSLTRTDINFKTFFEEASEKIPTFKGIYYCSADLETIVDVVSDESRKYSIFFGGSEKLLAGAFTVGFNSAAVPLLNLFPEKCLGIMRAINESDLTKAITLQKKLSGVCLQMEKYEKVSTMKSLMGLITGVNVGPPKAPLTSLTEEQINDLMKYITLQF